MSYTNKFFLRGVGTLTSTNFFQTFHTMHTTHTFTLAETLNYLNKPLGAHRKDQIRKVKKMSKGKAEPNPSLIIEENQKQKLQNDQTKIRFSERKTTKYIFTNRKK